MLKLHELEIAGFKTFVDPVTVRFAGGITAIVGPNGCGKSNLSDAITWVLGEQSAKSLRGTKMQDVIFSGSEKRKPIGLAEVTLILTTDPSAHYAVDGKLRISRRVFREGGSQYKINGKTARLKEIKDLLMDTGLGIRAYSVIEQGKIGMILSTKPQERRKLLEEAAGITRYKARKKVAEVKLEEAIANLLRLDDIISEIDRGLRSLKRQASAARRYQEKEKEYRELLRIVLLGRWSLIRGRLDGIDTDLDALVKRDAELSADLHRDEAGLAAGREELDRRGVEVATAHQRAAELAATIEGRQEFLRGARQRRQEVDERIQQGDRQAEQRQKQASELQGSLGELDTRALELVAEREEAARQVAEDDERIAAAQQSAQSAESRLEGLRQELLTTLSQVNGLRSTMQHEQVEIEKRTLRQRFLDEERGRLERQLDEAEVSLAAIDGTVAETGNQLENKSQERQALQENLDAMLRREAELGEERRDLEDELLGLRQRRQILVELSQEHAERRRSLIDKLTDVGLSDPSFLAEQVSPPEGWESVVDLFLDDLADAVVLEGKQNPVALARSLARHGSSGIFIRPASKRAPLPLNDPAVRHDLADALDLPPALAGALPPACLVDTADEAARLAPEHPGVAFLSRDRIWAQGGTVRVQAEASTPGVLARESELVAIRTRIPELEARLSEVGETLNSLVDKRTDAARRLNRYADEIAELRRAIAVAQARRQDAAGRREKLSVQHKTVTEEQAEIRDELGEKSTQREALGRRLNEVEAAHQQLNDDFDRCQAEVEAAREHRETLRTAGAGRRGRLELLEERMTSQSQEVVRVRKQIAEASSYSEKWGEERETLERRASELDVSMEQAEQELQGALENRSSAQEEVLGLQQALDAHRDSLREIEGRVLECRSTREELRRRIEQSRIDRASARQDAEHLAATYREEFKRLLPGMAPPPQPEVPEEDAEAEAEGGEVPELVAEEEASAEGEEASSEEGDGEAGEGQGGEDEAGEGEAGEGEEEEEEKPEVLLEEDAEVPDLSRSELAEMEGNLARLKATLERLGPVNVLAAVEYEEQEERGGFLKTQRRDVAESVASLKETIREINEASSLRFKETFEQVNKTFGETFQRLFRGGEAYMRLFDEEDILETGIEIVARPPGKRPQNITLLSGGEKALTAIALLFALFQTKPSPFCILDEVDAPLDDVNVLRFVDTLQEMAKDTQFLVVTHNKITMETASSLYGVTMEERGVSKLVGVEMDEVHPPRQLAETA